MSRSRSLPHVAALATLAATLLVTAACSDTPTGPTGSDIIVQRERGIIVQRGARPDTVAAATSADAIGGTVIPLAGTTAIARVVRPDGTPLGGTMMRFEAGGENHFVTDGDARDEDTRPGHFRVRLPLAFSYSANVAVVPDPYTGYGPARTMGAGATTTDFGTFTVHLRPSLNIYLAGQGGITKGGTKFTITGVANYIQVVVDGGLNDLNPATAWVKLRVPGPGTYKICETVPPSVFQFMKPACQTWEAKLGQEDWTQYSHEAVPIFIGVPLLTP